MTKFQIEYNPYRVETTFKKNGKPLGKKSRLMSKKDIRIQQLFEPMPNWDGLLDEIAKECNDDNIELHFAGRRIDYEDIEYSAKRYNGDVKFDLSLSEQKNDNDIIKELDRIISEIKRKDLPQFFEKDKNGKTILDAYEEAKNGVFEVSVIATMSSGKSTLINALLHTELLPSENKACTAAVASILDNDDMDHFEAAAYAADENTVVFPRQNVDLEKLKEFNSNEKVQYIDIEGDIPNVYCDKIRLCLRDTPGPNNSRDENHGRLTSAIIKQNNAIVLYVMNATQFGIKDDEQLLRDISNEMKRAGKQSRDRFIFVVNKCDELDEERGETIDDLLKDVAKYLEGFGITQPILIPTSARLALLVRKNRNGEPLTRQENKALNDVDYFVDSPLLHFEKYATLPPSVREKLDRMTAEYHSNEENRNLEAVIHSGVPAVEGIISEYIDKYAYPIKIYDAVKGIIDTLDDLNMKAEFEKSIASDKDKLKAVQKQIDESRKKYDDSLEIHDEYKEKISSMTFDRSFEREAKKQADKQMSRFASAYQNSVKIDKEEADRKIRDFQDDLIDFQAECESNIIRDIDESIFAKCSDMLAEYSDIVSDVIGMIDITGFDFNKISSIKKFKIKNVDSIIKKNEHDRMREETHIKKNPERAGFLGKFKFWKPKTVEYTVEVKDGTDVNLSKVIAEILSQFSSQYKKNITDMYQQAELQTEEYKKVFIQNIDLLYSQIDNVFNELKKMTDESDDLQKRVDENKALEDWCISITRNINDLISL